MGVHEEKGGSDPTIRNTMVQRLAFHARPVSNECIGGVDPLRSPYILVSQLVSSHKSIPVRVSGLGLRARTMGPIAIRDTHACTERGCLAKQRDREAVEQGRGLHTREAGRSRYAGALKIGSAPRVVGWNLASE